MGATTAMEVRYCAWCGDVAVGEKLTHRGVVRKGKDGPLFIAAQTVAWACAKHMGIPHNDEPVTQKAKYAAGCKARKRQQERLF